MQPMMMPLVAALLLAGGCATTPMAEITRFNIGQPIARDSIRIEPMRTDQAGSLEFAALAASVQAEFAAAGFPAATTTPAAYIAVLGVEQQSRDGAPRGPAVTVGVGGGVGGGGGGGGAAVGGGIAVPIAGGRPGELRLTLVSLRIRRVSDGSVLWEGRAQDDQPAGADSSAPAVAVPRLVRALLDGFPGANGETIRVKTR